MDRLYRELFETVFEDNQPVQSLGSKTIYHPVSEAETGEATRNWKNSAAGPDAITVNQIKECPSTLLTTLFNVILYRYFTLSVWRANRMILLPKEGDRSLPSNWRPITIGSAEQRLNAVAEHHPLQIGFRDTYDCLANVLLLEQYIKSRRLQEKTYNLVSLDVRKAFDTVSHESIIRGLTRLGQDHDFMTYIRGMGV